MYGLDPPWIKYGARILYNMEIINKNQYPYVPQHLQILKRTPQGVLISRFYLLVYISMRVI